MLKKILQYILSKKIIIKILLFIIFIIPIFIFGIIHILSIFKVKSNFSSIDAESNPTQTSQQYNISNLNTIINEINEDIKKSK